MALSRPPAVSASIMASMPADSSNALGKVRLTLRSKDLNQNELAMVHTAIILERVMAKPSATAPSKGNLL